MYTTISFETRDGVTHITLNRPDSANTLNATLSSELMDTVVRCEDDADIRAVVPVVAAVNGAAAGAGMGLACACDLVIAAESARFTTAYTKVGLSPDGST